MASIFFSYRRDDSAFVMELIRDELHEDYPDEIFTDVDGIPFGVDFRESLVGALSRCKVVLAVIGKNWLDIKDKMGQRRLDDPTDHLRIEIETALQRKIPIIPLLVGGAEMPSADELPGALKELSYRNGMPLRAGRDTKGDLALLKVALKQILEEAVPEKAEQEKPLDHNRRGSNDKGPDEETPAVRPVTFVTPTPLAPPVPGFFSNKKIVPIITLSVFSILFAGILFLILWNVVGDIKTDGGPAKDASTSSAKEPSANDLASLSNANVHIAANSVSPTPEMNLKPEPLRRVTHGVTATSSPEHPPRVTHGGTPAPLHEPSPTKPVPKDTPHAVPKTVSGGVLNGKATSLPKPAYPAAARAVRASGAVSVQVLISESGSVISANAVSGHPLLRAAAEAAARGARFSPTQMSGQSVKVSGVIIFHFVP